MPPKCAVPTAAMLGWASPRQSITIDQFPTTDSTCRIKETATRQLKLITNEGVISLPPIKLLLLLSRSGRHASSPTTMSWVQRPSYTTRYSTRRPPSRRPTTSGSAVVCCFAFDLASAGFSQYCLWHVLHQASSLAYASPGGHKCTQRYRIRASPVCLLLSVRLPFVSAYRTASSQATEQSPIPRICLTRLLRTSKGNMLHHTIAYVIVHHHRAQ
jgi:hypothetical protein